MKELRLRDYILLISILIYKLESHFRFFPIQKLPKLSEKTSNWLSGKQTVTNINKNNALKQKQNYYVQKLLEYRMPRMDI